MQPDFGRCREACNAVIKGKNDFAARFKTVPLSKHSSLLASISAAASRITPLR
jgi:hypothetical protein